MHTPLLLQVGEPRGLCHAEGGGVFSREYSGGTARLDFERKATEFETEERDLKARLRRLEQV